MTRAYFGEFLLPVKAARIKKPRKYSDVTIIKPGVGRHTVSAGRPVHSKDWEPEYVTKK